MTMIRHARDLVLALTALFVITGEVLAQKPARIFQSLHRASGANLAIGGFDTVAYHTQRAAVEGNPLYRVSWEGAEWRFSTVQNRDLFVQNPTRYAPQFGGYCAYAAAFGQATGVDPRVFDLFNGRLYLNQSQSVQSLWARDKANLITRAEQQWPNVVR